jgi:hypothetical protein
MLAVYSLLICTSKRRNHSAWVKNIYANDRTIEFVKYCYRNCVAANEALNRVHNLQMDIHTFEELLSRFTIKICFRFVLSATRQKSVHIDTEHTNVRLENPKKCYTIIVRGLNTLFGDPGHRSGSPTGSGRVAIAEFRLNSSSFCVTEIPEKEFVRLMGA